jgi:hypothetical protein
LLEVKLELAKATAASSSSLGLSGATAGVVSAGEVIRELASHKAVSADVGQTLSGHKVTSGAFSQSFGISQTLSGHKVEFPAEPATIDAEAIEKAIALIAAVSFILQQLHAPDPLLGGVVFWLFRRTLR